MSLDISASAALWFLLFAAPICIWVAWSDLKMMKILNLSVMALLGVFLVVGVFVLPLRVIPWQLLNLVVVLVLGFILNMVGGFGAGDAKFAAAAAPFVARGDIGFVMMLLATLLILAFIVHRVMRATPAFRRLTPGWESWEHKDFPMGLALGPTLLTYLALGAVYGS